MKLLLGNSLFQSMVIFVIASLAFTWLSTQGFKIMLKLFLGEKFHAGMIFADGDFPSTHTSIVISSLCTIIFLTWFGRRQDLFIWQTCCDVKSILIMGVLAGIAMRDAIGQRHRQDNTNQNLKNLKDFVAGSVTAENLTLETSDRKCTITNQINKTFAAIDNEALKRVGHLKHEVVGGILSGFLGSTYSICVFFGYFKWLPILFFISLVYFFGMGNFLKLLPILQRLYTNFKE